VRAEGSLSTTGPRWAAFTIGSFVLAALLALLVAASSLAVTVRHVPEDVRRQVQQLFPEGWPLFTRDPPALEARVAIERSGDWSWADRGPLGKPINAFGFHKAPIAQNVEVAIIASYLPARDRWPACEGPALRCLRRVDEAGGRTPRAVNSRRNPTFCGRIGIVYPAPEPWARKEETTPTRVLVADVTCNFES
jgi:hypothetical protein